MKKIADADKVGMAVVNLYIGGCSLRRHFRNMKTDERVYAFAYNGEDTGIFVSLKEAVLSRKWDYITVQQVSHESTDYDTYQPYLKEIVDFVRELSPKAKIVIHQTWAYEEGSKRLCQELKYDKQIEMFEDLKASYMKAYKEISADMLIPSGELFQSLVEKGMKVHRDTFHATYGIGRYALSLLWYAKITGNKILKNTFSDFDEEVSENEVKCIKNIVEELTKRTDLR